MCGLVGLFLPRQAVAKEANLGAMLAAIGHRGPNGQECYVSPDRRFQAGFARLAIIDLATGDQPIIENDGARVLMGNGEIYNYQELRAETPSYPWRTQGDIEVVLPQMDRHGEGFVEKLNGMYALAVYEREAHRLLLVRDRLGIKPLYWVWLANGGILFASEIKALFASGLVSPAVDSESVSSYLAHGYVPAPRTLYKGVNKLAPGHVLRADSNGVAVESYWRPRPQACAPLSAEFRKRQLVELLRDSVRLQLRSDVPVGALLSGGIDSGLIVALAAEQLDRPLNTYTVSFQGASIDEAPLAAEVAARYGTNHTTFELSANSILDHLPRLAWFADEPLADASMLPNQLIEAELASHVTVVLNGTGGDELFAGYGRYFPLPVEERYLRLPRWLRKGLVEPLAGSLRPMEAWQLRRAEKAQHDPGGYVFDHACHFPPPMRALIGNHLAAPDPAQRAALAGTDGPAQTRMLIADLATYLPEDLLLLLDRTTMAASVEGRVPFLDHRLVEAALAIPPAERTPNGRQKGLLRDIAADFLPRSVLAAPKQGFASPVPAWVDAGFGAVARRLLTARRSLDRMWWTERGINALLADPRRHGFRLYSLVMLEMAVRLHVEGQGGSVVPTGGLQDFADAA